MDQTHDSKETSSLDAHSTWSLLKHDREKYTKLVKYVESTVTNALRTNISWESPSDETSVILVAILQSIAFAYRVASSMPIDVRPAELGRCQLCFV